MVDYQHSIKRKQQLSILFWKIQGFYTIENDVTLNFEKEELEFTTKLEAIQNPAEQAKYIVSQIMNYISMIYNVGIKN